MLSDKIKKRYSLLFLLVLGCIALFKPAETHSQGRDRSKFQFLSDTSRIFSDTSKIIDTTITKKEPVDSTARIKNFKYDRKDSYIPQVGDYKSPLLLYGSSLVEYKLSFEDLDSVTIRQYLNGDEIKYPVKIPFDKYMELRSSLAMKNQMYNIMAEKFKIETKDELEQLFKNITDITIPLPFATETIFGPPTINLKINGIIDITASYQRSSSDQATILTETQTQNNINFKQEVQVTTKGSVGDKLTIDADWNSQRTFDFENQLKLKYQGYPDEVIQRIEAGNVSLETKSNLIGSTQALFGIKGQFKLGPLTLTTIASQKKSEKKEVNITGGSQEINFEIPAYQYSDNHFFLDTFYLRAYEEFYRNGSLITPSLIEKQVNSDIEVWVQTTPSDPNKRKAVCWIDLPIKPSNGYDTAWTNQTPASIDGRKYTGYFTKLNPGDYTLHEQAGYISINVGTLSAPNDAVAVAYKFANNPNIQYGTFTNENIGRDSLVLKLVRHPNLLSPYDNSAYALAWLHKIKSIYSVGVRNIKNDAGKFQFSVYYKPASGEIQTSITDRTYLNRTKLDIRQAGNYIINGVGDGQFDFFPDYTIDLTSGEVIFPTLSPFYQTLRLSPDSLAGIPPVPDSLVAPDSAIYVYSKTAAQNQTNPIKFYMGGKATGDASSRYSLGFNVVEGSVKVFNGSVELVQGVDYTVDYGTGELLIRNASALTAGANLKITYETNDLFQLASKTLLGARAEYQINKNSYVGFTLLNLKQQTLNDKVRIGEEPTNNTIMGFDASTDIKTNFITNLINKIPGYNTKEESLLSLKGEVAFMIPDPNTKKSKIPSDNGESVAYIDDFEGAKKIISLGTNPLSWIVSSIPFDSLISFSTVDSLMSIRRSKLEWYNLINNVPIKEVYPNREIASSQNSALTPLVFRILPKAPGMFTYISQNDFLNLPGGPEKKWTGVFKYLNTSQTNLLDENMGFIQIWMQMNNNGAPPNDSAKMVIDLGIISEKIISNRDIDLQEGKNYHTEDANSNGTLDEGEDVGLDGIPNNEELQLGYPNLGGDPSGDNFAWTQGSDNFTQFNGTEGNANLTEGKRIDTEDLNGNGSLDEIDNYFRFEMPLTTDSTKNRYITGRGNNGWYQYSIPLNDYTKTFNRGSMTNVQYIRVWFKGCANDTTTLKIVDFNIVGNQWQKTNKNDTSYSIAVVNIEENSDIYNSPVPGDILRQRDQSSIDANTLQNEQSMSLEVRNLVQGPGKYAYKFFNVKALDLLNYKIIKLFVNGDPSFKYTDTSNYDAAVVVRLGSDSLNYYEYRAPLHPDKRPATPWTSSNEITINITDLTQVKQLRDSAGTLIYFPVPNGPLGSKFGVIGNPTITSITQIALGVVNNKKSIVAEPITGSVWFNEMRVLKTNDKSGYAFTVGAGLKMADLGTLNFSFSKTDPNFHSLEGRFGNRILSNSWEFSGTLNLHKILNSLLASALSIKLKDFFTIPIAFSHTEVYDKPKFMPGTDIDLETAVQNKYNEVLSETNNTSLAEYYSNQVRLSSQTLRITNRFAVNGFKFTFPSDNFFAREILNKIEFSFYRNSITERTPVSESKYAWDMGGSVGITSNLDLLDKLHLSIGKLIPLGDEYKDAKIYFFFPFVGLAPLYSNTVSLGTSFTRNRGDEQLRNQLFPNPTTRNFNANRNFNLDWKFIENWVIDVAGSYSFTAGSDLTYLETSPDSLKLQRSESEIFNDIFFNKSFINFGKDLSYSQSVNINPRFNIPGLKKYLDITSSYRVSYRWQPSLQTINVGNAVGYNADFQLSGAFKLKQIYDLFKSSGNEIKGGSQSQDDKQNIGEIIKLLGTFLPDQVNMTYSQAKAITNSGIAGRPGFANFWVMFGSKEEYGPSRLYQLGWKNDPGKRVPFVSLGDAEGYSNTLNLSTFITPIFPNNLKISFTYKTTWSQNSQLNYITNEFGDLGSPTSVLNINSVTRPSFLFSGDLVNRLAEPDIFLPNSEKSRLVSESFENDIASFPFPSWNITLSGVEKFEMFSGFATAVSIENAFSSDYKKTEKYTGGTSLPTIDNQNLTSGFTPLIGINVTFKEIEGGNLTASFKINKTNNYDLTPATLVVNNTATSDLSINASYTKQGFKIPLFGLALDNDISVAFSYTRTNNDPRVIKYEQGIWRNDALNGSVSTTLNPSIQYALSKSVSVQLFYKFTKVEPSEGSQQIPTRTSNEAGLNLKLSIQ